MYLVWSEIQLPPQPKTCPCQGRDNAELGLQLAKC